MPPIVPPYRQYSIVIYQFFPTLIKYLLQIIIIHYQFIIVFVFMTRLFLII